MEVSSSPWDVETEPSPVILSQNSMSFDLEIPAKLTMNQVAKYSPVKTLREYYLDKIYNVQQ